MRVVPLLLAFAVAACDPISMERVPSEAKIRAWDALKPFVAGCGEIRGVYQNLDVDSVVFHCHRRFESESEFWRLIAESISGRLDRRHRHPRPAAVLKLRGERRSQAR
jgi:hypothetical protein